MNVFSVIDLILNFVFGIAILVYYFSHFKEVNAFLKYGIFILIIYSILEFSSGGIDLSSTFLLIISCIKIVIYTCLGMYICSNLRYKDIPLIRKLFRDADVERIDIKSYILSIAAVIICSAAFSYVLFKITSPAASEFMKKSFGNGDIITEVGRTPSPGLILTITGVVITEELSVRFVIQNFFAKQFKLVGNRYWIAIVLSSLFWTLAHANMLNPDWVKFVQIFPIGIALGGIFKKFGLESSIFAHAGFNVIMVFISKGLIRI